MPLYPPSGGGGGGSGAAVWLNYNLLDQTVRESHNVASVTYNGTGDITLNFSDPLADANFAMLATGAQNEYNEDGYTFFIDPLYHPHTASTCRVFSVEITAGFYFVKNIPQLCVACFR